MTSSAKIQLLDEMIADSKQKLAGLKASVELEEKYLQDLMRRRSDLPNTPTNSPVPRQHLPVAVAEGGNESPNKLYPKP